jgi:hypothetical protein
MSSDNECDATNYGIDDEYAKSFGPDEGFEYNNIGLRLNKIIQS